MSVNIHDYLAIARLVLHQQRQPADAIPAWGPKHSTQFWTTSPAIPDLTTTVSSHQLSLFVVVSVVLVCLYQ